MRALVVIVTALAALYAGYWIVGQRQVETRARAALADLEARGWDVSYSSLETVGFPSRFDTTVEDVRLASPDGSLAWEAPFVTVYALSYRPNRVIAVFPEEQVVTVAGRPYRLTTERLRASAGVGLSAALPFRDATAEAEGAEVTAEGLGLGLGRLLAAVRAAPGGTATYDLYLDAADLRPLGAEAALDHVRLDAQVTLDAPLGLRAAEAPRLLALSLAEASVGRGAASLSASGDLGLDAEGFLAGEVVIAAESWRGVLDAAEAAGLLAPGARAVVERALEGLSEGEDRFEVPVTFADGVVTALGLPLLDAPRLR